VQLIYRRTDSVEGTGDPRTIMCFPLRSRRGTGSIIGVIRLLNKRGYESEFETSDVSVVQAIIDKSTSKYEEVFSNLQALHYKICAIANPIRPIDIAPRLSFSSDYGGPLAQTASSLSRNDNC
jgi:hypothetical protein